MSDTIGVFAAICIVLMGCTGYIDDTRSQDGDRADPFAAPDEPTRKSLVWLTGARRLTRSEYTRTVESTLGIALDARLVARLPEDEPTTFGNDFQAQKSTEGMIGTYEALAEEIAWAALGDTRDAEERIALVECRPSGSADQVCFQHFIEVIGLRMFRRPLSTDEVERYASLLRFAEGAGDGFFLAARLVLRVFLQHPRFLFRVEGSTDGLDGHPEVFRLDDWEVATRLAFALTGTAPDDELLEATAAGDLATAAGLESQAERLLESPDGHEQVQRFHARWLGYESMPTAAGEEALADALTAETRALLEYVIFEERRPWIDIFRVDGTFLNDQLAEHYGLPAPGSDELTWSSYGDSGRAGILSHGTFLSNGRRDNDTSVVARGLFVLRRLLCQDIPPPPPNVDADNVPERTPESPCKVDVSAARQDGMNICANCHRRIDPIGFGLERYDGLGRYRTAEPDYPECEIEGEGAAPPLGEFHGPGDLGQLLTESDELDRCMATQLYTFVSGHEPDAEEFEALEDSVEAFRESGGYLDELLLDLVTRESFRYRRQETE